MSDQHTTEGDMEESGPIPLGPHQYQHRRAGDPGLVGPRRLIRFDPTVSSGTLIQIASILVGFGIAYGTYREDQTKTRAEIDAVKVSAERDRADSRGAVNEIRSDVKDMKSDISQINKTMAVLEAQGRIAAQQPARQR